ncbi:unnamed protein product [Ectocarpus sp. 13 AM-2016]
MSFPVPEVVAPPPSAAVDTASTPSGTTASAASSPADTASASSVRNFFRLSIASPATSSVTGAAPLEALLLPFAPTSVAPAAAAAWGAAGGSVSDDVAPSGVAGTLDPAGCTATASAPFPSFTPF